MRVFPIPVPRFKIVDYESIFPKAYSVTIFGEAYGQKVQAVGHRYIKEANNFIIFDIKINNIDATGKFDLNAGTWSDNTDCVNNIAMNKWTTAADGAKYTFDAILIPQTAAASLSITLSTGAVYQLAIPEQAYAMGKNYTIKIQVGQDKVELGNITQTDWESVTGGDLTAQ